MLRSPAMPRTPAGAVATHALAACLAAGATVLVTQPSFAQSSAPSRPQAPSVTEPAPAQRTVERNAAGRPATDIRVGVFVNVRTDCTSGPLPTIRLAAPPSRGKVEVKSGKVSARNYKQCLALEVPAHVAFYRSEAGFSGSDAFTLEVRYPQGRVEVQKITVNVSEAAPAPRAPQTAPPRGAPKTQGI